MTQDPDGASLHRRSPRLANIANPQSANIVHFPPHERLKLDCGAENSRRSPSPTRPTGELNAAKSNLVLACHALTGDQHVASFDPVTKKPGWWETMVGPGKAIDTQRYFVLCANVIGGCLGTTGARLDRTRYG